jgi:SAM-dependent methyltransferase
MNEKHLTLCSSAEWADALARWIIPWTLEGVDLGDDVIEIGPGPGHTTEVLRALTSRLTAVEIDDDLASNLISRFADTNVEVVHGDAAHTGLTEGRFSAAVALTMLHHVPGIAEQDAVLGEALRLLRPGGLLAGSDSLDGPDFRELHVGDVCVPLDPANLADRLTGIGYVDVQVDTNEWAVRFRAHKSS